MKSGSLLSLQKTWKYSLFSEDVEIFPIQILEKVSSKKRKGKKNEKRKHFESVILNPLTNIDSTNFNHYGLITKKKEGNGNNQIHKK